MTKTTVAGLAVSGLQTTEILFFLLLVGFYVIFFYKLYKIFKVGENYDLPKIVLTSILGILLYGLSFILLISETVNLTYGYFAIFQFTTGLFIFFFIFIFIDLFIGMKRFNTANKMEEGKNSFMLQRSEATYSRFNR